ncbi:CoA ester lyase [Brevundimonas sp. AJA228-03]|uniref:HpcH/HpaI aldolase/citrate lyase family protein n=1 Tax=Brevundimonas sp. AJA228-03 TaxID=2752515 RepID=UPI001ADF97C6|nr:CoA ester lyase [Brevundimonas sp. AJA228-03]QTN20608.1 CoA ester lyase [Brevundimonas sp. AJA228-03]
MKASLVRSVLFLPASNPRAIEKARGLDCDLAVLDLEDAVAPEMKAEARAAAIDAVRAGGFRGQIGVRVNALGTAWGEADLAALTGVTLDWIVAPKVEEAGTVDAYEARMAEGVRLCAMIETPRALLDLPRIGAAGGPLGALMLGVNDLAKALGTGQSQDREPLKPCLAATVAAAKAHGLLAIDGVFNRLDDAGGLAAECAQGRLFGFDGKSLIHPSQIEAAHSAFSPTPAEVAEARAVVAAFATPEAEGKGAIRVNGAMAERLHLVQAQALLDRAAACG